MRTKPINTPSPTHTLSTPPRLRLIYWQAVMNDPPTSTYTHVLALSTVLLQITFNALGFYTDFVLTETAFSIYMFDFLTDKQYTCTQYMFQLMYIQHVSTYTEHSQDQNMQALSAPPPSPTFLLRLPQTGFDSDNNHCMFNALPYFPKTISCDAT